MCSTTRRSFGLPTAVLRMSCIYGPRQIGTEDQGWVAHFLIRALAGEPITIYRRRPPGARRAARATTPSRPIRRWRRIDAHRRAGLQPRRRPRQRRQPAPGLIARHRGRSWAAAVETAASRLARRRPALLRLRHAPGRAGARPAGAAALARRARAPGRLAAGRPAAAHAPRRWHTRRGRAMRVALVNPPWRFDTSIYFGCREPHLPLELGATQGAAGGGRARRAACSTAILLRRDECARARRRRAAFAPDMTVVTTAPTYLFWRCAPPELRVPREFLDGARWARGRRTVAVGPHGSVTPRAALRKLGVDVVVRGECEEIVCPSWPTRGRWRAMPSIAFRDGDEIRVTGGPHASALHRPARPALAGRLDRPARPSPPSLRSAATEPRRRGRGVARLSLFLQLLRQDRFPRHYRRRDARAAARGDRRADRPGRRATSISSTRSSCRRSRCSKRWSARGLAFGIQTRIDLWKPDMLDLLGRSRLRLDRSRRREPDRRRPRGARQELPHVDRRAGRPADPRPKRACRSCRPT